MPKKGRDTKPEYCTHPDYFSCRYKDCIWDGRLGYDPIKRRAESNQKEREMKHGKIKSLQRI